MVRHALIALYRGDAASTIMLARRSQEDPAVLPRIRGLGALREAQGYALAGDRSQCERALEHGAELLAAVSSGDVSRLSLGPVSVPDTVTLTRGWCYHDLGRPEDAVAVLAPQVARIPASSRRSFARFGTRLANAYAASGEVQAACDLSVDVFQAALAVDSATVRIDLVHLARTLNRWHTRPAVRDMSAQLTTALHTKRPT
jgi:hypothetical protein